VVRPGSSLVEVIVALLLTAIGLSALGTASATSLRLAASADQSARRVLLAGAVLDSILAAEVRSPGFLVVGSDTLRWSIEDAGRIVALTIGDGRTALRVRVPPLLPMLDP